ncbi:MAG: PKD domain-containing protein, partial [Methanosarcinales archaeon]
KADTVLNSSITHISNDAVDSTDASPVNSDLLVVKADTVLNSSITHISNDAVDSTDSNSIASNLYIANADTIWNTRTVKMENQPPIANAGEDQTVPDNLPVTLNGSNSTDEAPIPFYRWTENSYILSTEKSFTRMFSIGTHRVVLTVIDENGTIAMDDVIINVYDATGPKITIFQPSEGQVFTTNTITVSGTASDPSCVQSVTVNGVYAGTTTWSRTITLTPGTNIITIVATDNVGNQQTATITVIYSHVPITNISVSSGVSYNQKTKILDISAYAYDNVY